MERPEGWCFSALLSGSFLLSCLLFSHISRQQRQPYMDELFHMPQAQQYCGGHFRQWDPMITTLPGLYLVSVGLLKPAAWLFGWSQDVVCSPGMLRFVNLLFGIGNLYLLNLLICKIHHKNKAAFGFQRILSSLTLSMLPPLYFLTFLYYTDAGSTFFTLFMYLMSLYGKHKTAALLGFCAFLFRQTNIIWIIFCAGSLVAEKLTEAWKVELSKKDKNVSTSTGSLPESVEGLKFLVGYLMSFKNVKTLLILTWPYAFLVLAFFGFLVFNGGIVVGDRSNHEACLNFPQLFYFFSFTLVFSFPYLLSPQKIANFLLSVWRQPVHYILLTLVSLLLVCKFTYVHKYLLADNRHYTFYIWQRIFQRHELVKYALVPGYIFAGWRFTDSLKSKSLFWNLMFFACIFVATVPQKLLEFRYFILPYLIYRLNVPLPSVPRQLLEAGLCVVVNALTVYLFLNKTFQWPGSEDIQRFMW
ncbi:dol-P-Glc:Glc(2)Man(9)GlcNAc(2)-PP-Dol alpha-1,2-glucosyltransferase A [Microcaecilia unicolor]|uniref:Dol-P-Glc:Glc(2)Man(9)GlcNAc(2)-PP-Dol alpha-1,2-glucosyltransferase n=1 Tax=Microcaecilia unicolor TaxID=1415580 RepID=A0A6P7Z4S1_9AMPH|nr:dol-P-Glc:Glc(2)Man(9)GlcNAc(2)-PP-Dol alpha-1,2-glucosyltransferase-like [Microcaecilia unicolor]